MKIHFSRGALGSSQVTRMMLNPANILESTRVIGTRFGVFVLEIIGGKKNSGFSHPDHGLNLLGQTWRLWCDGNAMQLVDESINCSRYQEEISRCIHIALLCVQKGTNQRPFMSSVVLMLSSENVVPTPQPPSFYIERSTRFEEDKSSKHDEACSSNDVSIMSSGGCGSSCLLLSLVFPCY